MEPEHQTTHYRVGDVSRLAHVSIRTLHHYDREGLVRPSARSAAGYRWYTPEDLERLQQVLFYRELGFGLAEIGQLLAVAGPDRRVVLHEQRHLLEAKVARLTRMLDLIDKTLTAPGGAMTREEMFAVFGDFDPGDYEDEVQERWGSTEAYRESARRTARYTKADWQRFKEESAAINRAIVALMDAGVAPDDPRAKDAVEQARLQIDRWFYPCSRAMHAQLGEMYVADARFTATYEKIRPGMAEYMHAATAANAARGD